MPNNIESCNRKSPSSLVPLYTPKQVYAIEKSWFDQGYQSYGLMQQAAWQISQWIHTHKYVTNGTEVGCLDPYVNANAYVWVGSGNNGGDGWCVARYLNQLGWQVTVIEVAQAATTDAILAKEAAVKHAIEVVDFEQIKKQNFNLKSGVFVDALFGIGLDREPKNDYAKAIQFINELRSDSRYLHSPVVSIDVPSGLVSSTGEVFANCAVKADVTLCLVARKLGLHIKDAADYVGMVVDIPLIPSVLMQYPAAILMQHSYQMPARINNTHKGSFGHALIIGGNQVDGSQGMGGAAILSAATAFASGVGKLTVACHKAFHGSLIDNVPNAMSIDLHDITGVKRLITECQAVALGMGLGRDADSFHLFETYLQVAIESGVRLVIDADGLYHLASLAQQDSALLTKLIAYASTHQVWYTPHSGEAARLLGIEAEQVEGDRLQAIEQLVQKFKGSWLLKGAGSLIVEDEQVYVCRAGNSGMATAGMGDVLSGLTVGLLAQTGLPAVCRSLRQAVLVHAVAGDVLQGKVGTWALQASDMPYVVGEVLQQLTKVNHCN